MRAYLIIHCKTQNELNILLDTLTQRNYQWREDSVKPADIKLNVGNYIYLYSSTDERYITYTNSCPREQYVEFSSIKDRLSGLLR